MQRATAAVLPCIVIIGVLICASAGASAGWEQLAPVPGHTSPDITQQHGYVTPRGNVTMPRPVLSPLSQWILTPGSAFYAMPGYGILATEYEDLEGGMWFMPAQAGLLQMSLWDGYTSFGQMTAPGWAEQPTGDDVPLWAAAHRGFSPVGPAAISPLTLPIGSMGGGGTMQGSGGTRRFALWVMPGASGTGVYTTQTGASYAGVSQLGSAPASGSAPVSLPSVYWRDTGSSAEPTAGTSGLDASDELRSPPLDNATPELPAGLLVLLGVGYLGLGRLRRAR